MQETKEFYKETHFHMTYKKLLTATHWISEGGEEVKLSHAFKAAYHHKLEQYKSFTKRGMVYKESHKRCANTLGIDFDMLRKVYIPLMKRMGLIVIDVKSPRNSITTMFELKYIKGVLINNKLKEKDKLKNMKQSSKKLTYEQVKNIEKNKKKIEKMRKDLSEEYFILTREDMERLRKGSVGVK